MATVTIASTASMDLERFGRDRKGGYVSDEKEADILYSSLRRGVDVTSAEASQVQEKTKIKVKVA